MTSLHLSGALTAPAEDYLKAIYEIERAAPGESVTTTDLAQRLAIAPASVTGMVKRLADQGLIDHERYRGVRLTGRGRLAALRTLRRHRVIEAYLAKALGYAWDRVHDEAERLEHAASDELVDRMAAAIGEPTVDPPGAPIPTRDGCGTWAPSASCPVSSCRFCVVRLTEGRSRSSPMVPSGRSGPSSRRTSSWRPNSEEAYVGTLLATVAVTSPIAHGGLT